MPSPLELYNCPACQATGLYHQNSPSNDIVTVCRYCYGTGFTKNKNEYVFTKRKNLEGVTRIYYDLGMWMLRGENTPTISREEFEEIVSPYSPLEFQSNYRSVYDDWQPSHGRNQ